MAKVISHTSRVVLKILEARLQQYVNQELPDVEKAEETEVKLPVSLGSSKKTREFQRNIYFCFIDCVDHNKLWKALKEMGITRPPDLPPEKPVYRSRSNS